MHGVDSSQFPEQYWELIERYRDALIEQARSILHSREDAEDAVQETFCEVIRNSAKLAEAQSVGAWLHAVNKSNALKRLRTERRTEDKARQKHENLPEDAFTTGGFSALELRDTVTDALSKLEPDLQTVVRMRYFENLSYKDIARRLKLDVAAVQRRLLQASNLLYGSLKIQLDPPNTGTRGASSQPLPTPTKGK
jgi:RNA polymerase sigma-70 factor (ECF subfamily)